MPVRLVFLGKLADLAGAPERELPAPLDWPGLLAALPGPLGEVTRGDKVRLALNGAILASPDKAVALPLLRRDLDNLTNGTAAANLALRAEVDRVYDLTKWFIPLMLSTAGGMIVLVVTNLWKAKTDR